MANAKKDENSVSSLLGTLNTDGVTVVPIKANPTLHRIKVNNNPVSLTTGRKVAPRDENCVPALLALSNSDGVTPVVVYADVDGKLLIDFVSSGGGPE